MGENRLFRLGLRLVRDCGQRLWTGEDSSLYGDLVPGAHIPSERARAVVEPEECGYGHAQGLGSNFLDKSTS